MTWKLNAFGKTRAGVTGVPWREMSDEEYEAVSAQFDEGALSVYFEQEPEPVRPQPLPDGRGSESVVEGETANPPARRPRRNKR